jgi:PAS domain S-box-containing protein
MSDLFHAVARATATTTGTAYFQTLVEQIALTLSVEQVWLTRCTLDQTAARMLAVWQDDRLNDPITYPLEQSPCEIVIHNAKPLVYKQGVGGSYTQYRGHEGYIGVPVFDLTGTVVGHLALLSNKPLQPEPDWLEALQLFAERAGAEITRQEQAVAFQAQFAYAPIAQLIVTADGTILQANAAAADLFRTTVEDLCNQTLTQITHPHSPNQPRILQADLLSGDTPFVQVEKRFIRADGADLYSKTTVFSLRNTANHSAVFIEDISERKRRDNLLQTAAHDLKNPLTNIASASSLLAEIVEGTPEAEQIFGLIQKSTSRMFELIHSLLDLSRLETGVKLNREPTAVNDFLAQVLSDFLLTAEQRDIRLTFTPLDEDVHLKIDPELMRQAVNNLLSNALKYTPSGGNVELTALQTADEVIIQVIDDGLGIPADELPKLFERFYRVSTTEHLAVDGTGLGLSIIKAIVEQHEGRVWVESDLGDGSRFYLALPA